MILIAKGVKCHRDQVPRELSVISLKYNFCIAVIA